MRAAASALLAAVLIYAMLTVSTTHRGTRTGHGARPGRAPVAPAGAVRRPGQPTVGPGRPVALTFDDGPSPLWTPQVLALLRRHHAHATFCLIGREARAYPWLVRQIVAGGNTLCDHTMAHDEQLGRRAASLIRADVRAAYAVIVAASGGVRPRYFRAPGGLWTPALLVEIRAAGLRPLRWDVDPKDWRRPGVRWIVAAVLRGARPGAVILLHDGGGRRDQTVAALRALLPALAARGLRPVAL